MAESNSLNRFLDAQASTYETALSEIKAGRKRTHWMWFIFPQIKGLGLSSTSVFYALTDLREAEAYLKHQVLGSRLIGICQTLLLAQGSDAHTVFGSPDDLKLNSCMTLFSSVPNSDPVFQLVIEKFFSGQKDDRTLQILRQQE